MGRRPARCIPVALLTCQQAVSASRIDEALARPARCPRGDDHGVGVPLDPGDGGLVDVVTAMCARCLQEVLVDILPIQVALTVER